MNEQDLYEYHIRQGVSHSVARSIGQGNYVTSRQRAHSVQMAGEACNCCFSRYPGAPRYMPDGLTVARAKRRKGLPLTDGDVMAWASASLFADSPAVSIRTSFHHINSRVPARQALVYDRSVGEPVFVRKCFHINGEYIPPSQVVHSPLFPGRVYHRTPLVCSAVVFRNKLKLHRADYNESELAEAGYVPLVAALEAVPKGRFSWVESGMILNVGGRTTARAGCIWVSPNTAQQLSGVKGERLCLSHVVSRRGYHGSDESRMPPPAGVERTFGVEWEVVPKRGTSMASLMSVIDAHARQNGVRIGFERDGSLPRSGVELVTAPYGLDPLLSCFNTATFGKKICPARTAEKGGIHIHVGRTAFTDPRALSVFALLFSRVENLPFIQQVSRRGRSRYVQFLSPRRGADTVSAGIGMAKDSWHFLAANLRSRTIEVRVFRSSSDPALVSEALRVVNTAVEYANVVAPTLPIMGELVPVSSTNFGAMLTWARDQAHAGALGGGGFITEEEATRWFMAGLSHPAVGVAA